jgi:O-antigen/teichoic acid export membrane protein
LGLDGYGIWNIVMTAATYMRFGTVGVKTAFQKYVADATGDGNYEFAAALLSTGAVGLLVLSLVGLIPAVLWANSAVAVAGVPAEFQSAAVSSVYILAAVMGLSNVCSVFEAILAGGHRIDLLRQFTAALSLAEAIGIVFALHSGLGISAMAAIMGASEVCYVLLCVISARRVLPELRLGWSKVQPKLWRELLRYAGTYQLVNVLEVAYGSVVPFAMLRVFGARSAGVYGVVMRIVGSASILQDAFLPSLLSGAAMILASGATARMRELVTRAFKVGCAFSMFPCAIIAATGPLIVLAWTGQSDSSFTGAFGWVCVRSVFQSMSLLALVLYRSSGEAMYDNARQLIRIGWILGVAAGARRLGFDGVLVGMAAGEFVGLVVMGAALQRAFRFLPIAVLVKDFIRGATTAGCLILICAVVCLFQPPSMGQRAAAALSLAAASVVATICMYPLARLTGMVTREERQAVSRTLFAALNMSS